MFNNALIAAALVGLASAQDARYTGGYIVDTAEFNMMYLPESDEVEFKVTMEDNSWFGLVLGQQDMT